MPRHMTLIATFYLRIPASSLPPPLRTTTFDSRFLLLILTASHERKVYYVLYWDIPGATVTARPVRFETRRLARVIQNAEREYAGLGVDIILCWSCCAVAVGVIINLDARRRRARPKTIRHHWAHARWMESWLWGRG